MKLKTAELTGPAIDWAVAKCMRVELFPWPNGTLNIYRPATDDYAIWEPSSRWEQGGPIIERKDLSVMPAAGEGWRAYATHRRDWKEQCYADGPTPLIAAMRCFVTNEMGDEVDVPEELLK